MNERPGAQRLERTCQHQDELVLPFGPEHVDEVVQDGQPGPALAALSATYLADLAQAAGDGAPG